MYPTKSMLSQESGAKGRVLYVPVLCIYGRVNMFEILQVLYWYLTLLQPSGNPVGESLSSSLGLTALLLQISPPQAECLQHADLRHSFPLNITAASHPRLRITSCLGPSYCPKLGNSYRPTYIGTYYCILINYITGLTSHRPAASCAAARDS